MPDRRLVCMMCKGSMIGEIGDRNDEEMGKNVIQKDGVIVQRLLGGFSRSGSR